MPAMKVVAVFSGFLVIPTQPAESAQFACLPPRQQMVGSAQGKSRAFRQRTSG